MRVVAVVGHGTDVGAACVERFTADGDTVEGVDLPGTSDDDAWDRCVSRIELAHGRVDVLVYAHSAMERAGAGLLGLSSAELQRVLDGNVGGLLCTVQRFVALLRRGHAPAVVVQASVDGLMGNPHVPAYSVAKGAQVVMTRMLAAELAPDGIRVNAVALAGVPIHRDALPDDVRAHTVAATPLGRAGRLGEVADVMAFLASERASYVTGATYVVDGGRLAVTPGTTL